MLNIWLATFNTHKVKEFKSLKPEEIKMEFHSAKEIDGYGSPKETGKTFLENAKIKAKSMRPFAPDEAWVLAEDSGLEVEALDNLPGIHSARYAGERASDLQNNDKLLKMLQFRGGANRKARYFCQIYAIGPAGEEFECSGICEGDILLQFRGTNGFGYDPLFVPKEQAHDPLKTMAELRLSEKNKISHRAKAFSKFLSLSGHNS